MAAKRLSSRVFLYRLRDIPAARHASPLFDLPPGYLDLAFYLCDEEHSSQMTLFKALKEPKIPGALEKRVHALNGAIVDLINEGGNPPVEADARGFHAGASYEDVSARFAADGFTVVHAADFVSAALRPRDVATSRAALARVEKAMSGHRDSRAIDSTLVDEAIETWSDVEEAAFGRLAEARALSGLRPTEGEEPSCVYRWGLLADRLRRAGFTEEDVEDAWVHGLAGDRQWPSTEWFALSLLPRLAAVMGRILAAGEDVDSSRALRRLLVDPGSDLPDALADRYRAGVAGALATADLGGALSAGDWEQLVACDEKRFGKLARKARPAPAPAPARRPPSSPQLTEIDARYGVPFPEEVLAIWDLACSLSPKDPCGAFADDDLLGVTLVGPFDLLAGRVRVKKGLDLRLHWRYHLDPPELFTVAAGNEDGLHFGYWFDDPAEGAACVAAYYARDAFELSVPGRTLGQALRRWIERAHAGTLENMKDDGGHERSYLRQLGLLGKLRDRLVTVATGERREIGEAYLAHYRRGAECGRGVIAPTPERMGVVAPANRYQKLSVAPEALRVALASTGKRKALVREALGLSTQGFPATALELGRTAWACGLDEEAYVLLDAAYAGLDRPALREVLNIHRKHRTLASVDVLSR